MSGSAGNLSEFLAAYSHVINHGEHMNVLGHERNVICCSLPICPDEPAGWPLSLSGFTNQTVHLLLKLKISIAV